jgi:hypothetical protein
VCERETVIISGASGKGMYKLNYGKGSEEMNRGVGSRSFVTE